MQWSLADGSLTFRDGGAHLSGLCPEVTISRAGEPIRWRASLTEGRDQLTARSHDLGLALTLRVESYQRATILRLTLRNESQTPVRLERVAPLAGDRGSDCRIGPRAAEWSVLRQGYQSWTGTRSFRVTEIDPDPYPGAIAVSLIDAHNPSPGRPGDFRSDLFALIANLESHDAVLAGFVIGDRAFGAVEVRVENGTCTRLAASLDYDGVTLAPGAELVIPPLWLAAGDAAHQLLNSYAEAVGRAMNARVPPRNPIGWCSWYYYFTRISEECIVENLQALAALRQRVPWDYVQVDDGYQAEIGDWLTPNAKFPRGMGWIAEQIRAAGFEAGIWTAPFIARRKSRLMREHPDWFVKDERGRPRFALWNPVWGVLGNCYALDTTHPEVLAWLRATFRTIAQEWGYRVLKLDFLYAASLPGRRHDSGATRAQALRRGLDAIREGAGPEAFLLGCGCPLAPAIGAVDAMRIGPDVAPWWSNLLARGPQRDLHGLATKHAIRNTLTRAFSHRRWWLNDPDCLMVRDQKTRLTDDEVRTLATVIAITDGMIILSDRVEQLSSPRLDLLDKTLALAGGTAEIIDLMRSDIPELVVSRSDERVAVAVFNFSDQPRSKILDLGALSLPFGSNPLDWWTGETVAATDGRVDLGTMGAHGCRVLVWRR